MQVVYEPMMDRLPTHNVRPSALMSLTLFCLLEAFYHFLKMSSHMKKVEMPLSLNDFLISVFS